MRARNKTLALLHYKRGGIGRMYLTVAIIAISLGTPDQVAAVKRDIEVRTVDLINAAHELEALRWESIQAANSLWAERYSVEKLIKTRDSTLPEKSLLEKMCGAVQEVAQESHSELPDPDYMGAKWH